MPQTAIFGPFFATMFLTLVVWAYMYIRSIGFIARSKLSPKELAVPGALAQLSAPEVSNPSDNLKNLFEGALDGDPEAGEVGEARKPRQVHAWQNRLRAHERIEEPAQQVRPRDPERLPENGLRLPPLFGDRRQVHDYRPVHQVAARRELLDAIHDDRPHGVEEHLAVIRVVLADATTISANVSISSSVRGRGTGGRPSRATGTVVDRALLCPGPWSLTPTIGWTSSGDGVLGAGGGITVSTLTAGTHRITVTVTDAAGRTGSQAITITVDDTCSICTRSSQRQQARAAGREGGV